MQAESRRGKRASRNSGFSLIELLIVVAIILIIAAIALPNFMRSRIAANEAASVQALRKITTATTTYATSYSNGYAPSLAALGGVGAPTCDASVLLDQVITAGQKHGYNFIYTGNVPVTVPGAGCTTPGFNAFTIQANPVNPGVTGRRWFFTDQTGVIRQNLVGPAGPADQPI